ncbi:MAG: hypothetical protein KGZ58_08700 [Ignavibacteriales bacterium]|nr:hypothetical protein [Ignavibacteriales bacterium]
MNKLFSLFTFTLLSTSLIFAGNISGKINFKGAAPKQVAIKMNADAKCVKLHSGKPVMSEQVVVNPNNTLRWAFVYVKNGPKKPAPKTPVVLDQKGCMYSPHVAGIQAGQPLEITNSDATLHNVHALPKNSSQFNIAQPKQGMKMTKSFEKPEQMVKIKCEVHNWMASYFGVMENPYFAVSDDTGKFEIKDVPAGEYEVVAWHEKFGEQTMKVKVTDKAAAADFTFEAK